MKKAWGRILLAAALLVMCALTLGGCWVSYPEYEGSFGGGVDMRESVTEGYFKLTIHTDKDEFKKDEAIDCWAELEYIGDEDSITVYVSGEAITMDMNGDRAYYSSSPGFWEQKMLTMEKGKPIRYTLADSLPKSQSVLPGEYEIDATANVSLSADGAVSYYGMVSAVIVVEE